MAYHELIPGQNHNEEISQNDQFDLDYNQNMDLGENGTLGLGDTHESESSSGHAYDNKQDLQLTHDYESVLGHTHDQELALGQSQDDDMTLPKSHDHGHGQELALVAQTQDSNFPSSHGFSVIKGHYELDQNLNLTVDQNWEMGVGSSKDMVVLENHLTAELDVASSKDIVVQENDLAGEMDVASSKDMVVQENHLDIIPIIQARSLVVSSDHELTVGKVFPDAKSCRRALRDAAIALHFEMQTMKSDKTRFTAKCAIEGCPWRIHAAKVPGGSAFTIRTICDAHNCAGITHLGHQQASAEWVGKTVEQSIRENPNYKPKEILEEIHRLHGITLSYKQAWRGKERVMAAVIGSFEEGYRLLPQYCEQVRRTNPGSIASVYGSPIDNCFKRLFISFQASIYGFVNACRPLLGLDRTPLKNKYHGTLLVATGFDGDGALFPLAFGVVEEENDDNWMWFLFELHNLLEVNTENMPRLTILSDRQKSIADAVEATFPTAFHGFCTRHISENFRKEFNNTVLFNLLWDAAHALTILDFEAKVMEIEGISREAAYWIRCIPPRLWATAYFEGTRYGHLTANIVESLNSWIVEASGLPIIQMMESIRRQLMIWFSERREASMQWDTMLVPSAERYVSEALECARSYEVLRVNEAEFEINSPTGNFTVDIRNRFCICHGWQLHGLPCSHAVAALLSCRQNVHRFTESCFTVATYRKAYSQIIHPIPDKSLWTKETQNEGSNTLAIVIKPPNSLRPPGRPKRQKCVREDSGREKRAVHCSRCNQTGHFRTTCSAPL